MEKLYNRINWENYPSDATPLNESNLNKLDAATNAIDDRVISMDKTKLDVSTANSMVKNVTYDESTGIFTVEYLNGSKVNIDTKLEKIAVNFTYDSVTQQIVITLDDETKQYIDLSTLITEYEFSDTATIAFSVTNGKVSAVIKNGSVTADKLEPNYLANVQLAASQAASSASAASASELAAKTSESNAKSSENSASASAASALESKESAATSEENALASKNSAESSAESALASKNSASTSASEASTSSASALESKNNAAQSAQSALSSAENAQYNAQTATSKAILAESYAKGGTGTRQGEDTDNAKYYMERAKEQSGDIPPYVAVKGDAETEFRTGQVNLTPDNIGAVSKQTFNNLTIGGRNFLKNSNVSFTADKNSSTTFRIDIHCVDDIDLNEIFLNKTATFSFFLNAPGARKSLVTGPLENRFGAHGAITWKNSSTGSTNTSYPFIILGLSVENQRVSLTEDIIPPSGYDSIVSIVFSIQYYCVPADDNDAIWKMEKFKFELGNKATDWTPAPEDLVDESKDYTDTKVADYLPLSGGTVSGNLTVTGNITGNLNGNANTATNATTVNGHTVNADVPSGAKFTDTTYDSMTGASISDDGTAGLVPKPTAGINGRCLMSNGTWAIPPNALKLDGHASDYYGVWIGGVTFPIGNTAGFGLSVSDPSHEYIKDSSIIDIYYATDSVEYASEVGMTYTIKKSGSYNVLFIAPKNDVTEQAIVIQNIKVTNP